MPSNRDIYTSANILITNRGYQGAIDHATERIKNLWEADDSEGMLVWQDIQEAIAMINDGVPA